MLLRLVQELDEGLEITVLVKDGAPAIPTVKDMVPVSAQSNSKGSCHALDYDRSQSDRQPKSTLTSFLSRPCRKDGWMLVAQSVTNPRQRIIDHGEVFTPLELVNHMLDLVSHECERVDSRFLEPACGDGNFLVEVLRRKLLTVDKKHARNREKWERDAILAVCSLYGIDLLPDNVAECRKRLLDVLCAAHEASFKKSLPEAASHAAAFILSRNIVQGDALTYRNADGRPIVFSEWSPINGALLKRRDFAYDHLLEHAFLASSPLFSDLGEDVFLPSPVGEYPPCHYLKLSDGDVIA